MKWEEVIKWLSAAAGGVIGMVSVTLSRDAAEALMEALGDALGRGVNA